MPKIDLRTLPAVTVTVKTITVVQPTPTGDLSFDFSFGFASQSSPLDAFSEQEIADEIADRYITRNIPLITGNGVRIPVSRYVCDFIAAYIAAERLTTELDPNDAERYLTFGYQCPQAWRSLASQFVTAKAEALGIKVNIEPDGDESEEDAAPKND